MKRFAVIVAAGSGLRMGKEIPKQFLPLLGKPVLSHTIAAFADTFPDISIVLVVPSDHMQRAKQIASHSRFPETIFLVEGADSRFGSVKAGLALVPEDAIVFIHDGVRCLPGKDLLKRCYDQACEKGNAIPAVAAVDSVRISRGPDNEWIDRNAVRLVQTPQTFRAGLLKDAYEQAGNNHFTDDAAVAESAGVKIHLVEGEITNIKVTHPIDLLIAEAILKLRDSVGP